MAQKANKNNQNIHNDSLKGDERLQRSLLDYLEKSSSTSQNRRRKMEVKQRTCVANAQVDSLVYIVFILHSFILLSTLKAVIHVYICIDRYFIYS